jgi:hypothetical protein
VKQAPRDADLHSVRGFFTARPVID